MWQYKHTDELYHAGVKGMKWGIRKAGIAPEPKKPPKYSKTGPQPKKTPKYAKTGPNNQAKSEKGKKVATTVLSTVGTVALSTAATLGTLYGIGRWVVNKYFN